MYTRRYIFIANRHFGFGKFHSRHTTPRKKNKAVDMAQLRPIDSGPTGLGGSRLGARLFDSPLYQKIYIYLYIYIYIYIYPILTTVLSTVFILTRYSVGLHIYSRQYYGCDNSTRLSS